MSHYIRKKRPNEEKGKMIRVFDIESQDRSFDVYITLAGREIRGVQRIIYMGVLTIEDAGTCIAKVKNYPIVLFRRSSLR